MIESRHTRIIKYSYLILSLADAIVVPTVCIVSCVDHTWYKIVFYIHFRHILINVRTFLLYFYLFIYINFIHLLYHFTSLILESIDSHKQILGYFNEWNHFLRLKHFFVAAWLAAKIFVSILFLQYFCFI